MASVTITTEGKFRLDPTKPLAWTAHRVVVETCDVVTRKAVLVLVPLTRRDVVQLKLEAILRVDLTRPTTLVANLSREDDEGDNRPGLANLDGVAIYCTSNRCTTPAVKKHRLPPLVGRLVVLDSYASGVVVRHHDDDLDERPGWAPQEPGDYRNRRGRAHSTNTLVACTLPARIRCKRCGERGRVIEVEAD